MNWADPILAEPYRVDRGRLVIPDRPGAGLDWDPAALRHYRADP
jgi:mandelate racemase